MTDRSDGTYQLGTTLRVAPLHASFRLGSQGHRPDRRAPKEHASDFEGGRHLGRPLSKPCGPRSWRTPVSLRHRPWPAIGLVCGDVSACGASVVHQGLRWFSTRGLASCCHDCGDDQRKGIYSHRGAVRACLGWLAGDLQAGYHGADRGDPFDPLISLGRELTAEDIGIQFLVAQGEFPQIEAR